MRDGLICCARGRASARRMTADVRGASAREDNVRIRAGMIASRIMRRLCALSIGLARLAFAPAARIDSDLTEGTIPRLEGLYATHKYTDTQVTQWYLDRIRRYDGVYRAFLYVHANGAL